MNGHDRDRRTWPAGGQGRCPHPRRERPDPALSARLRGARRRPAVLRNVGVGALAMAVTYGVGLGVGALT